MYRWSKLSIKGNEIWWIGTKSGWISSGVFTERWYGNVIKACETVE